MRAVSPAFSLLTPSLLPPKRLVVPRYRRLSVFTFGESTGAATVAADVVESAFGLVASARRLVFDFLTGAAGVGSTGNTTSGALSGARSM